MYQPDIVNGSSQPQLIVWCAEGFDELQEPDLTLFKGNYQSPPHVVVCMQYGPQATAKKISEITGGEVTWIQTSLFESDTFGIVTNELLVPACCKFMKGQNMSDVMSTLKDELQDDIVFQCDHIRGNCSSGSTSFF